MYDVVPGLTALYESVHSHVFRKRRKSPENHPPSPKMSESLTGGFFRVSA
jgi:hypothetical protein